MALLGADDNGESMLMECVMGLLRPSAGRIVAEIDGERFHLVGMATGQIETRGVVLVPESRHILPQITVEEALYLGAMRAQTRQRIRSNLDLSFSIFPRLSERCRQLASGLRLLFASRDQGKLWAGLAHCLDEMS